MQLTFCHSLGGQPGAVLYEIVQEYNKDHTPAVQLETVNPQNYATAAKEALKKPPEERPHFILAPEYMTGAMQQALKEGIVISTSSLLDPDKLDDIAEIVSKTFGVDSLPFNPACGVLYINKTLLQESGFAPEWKPHTLEDLINAAKQVQEKTGTAHGYTCAWPEAYLVEIVLAQQNLSLLDKNGDYDFVQLSGHILNLRQLVNEKVLLPPNTGNYDHTRDFFIQGKVAFYMQGSGHSTIIEQEAKNAGFEIGYAPLPTLSKDQKVKYAFPLGGAAIWVFNTNTDKAENNNVPNQISTQEMVKGVRSFLNYLASKEVQAKWHMSTAYVPVSKSLRESLQDFYKDHPLHEAVVAQTIEAPLGENSFGIKKADYYLVRPKLYPLIRELLLLEGSNEEVSQVIKERLESFEVECNQKPFKDTMRASAIQNAIHGPLFLLRVFFYYQFFFFSKSCTYIR